MRLIKFFISGAGSFSLTMQANNGTCTMSYFATIDSGNGSKTSWARSATFFGSQAEGGHCASDKSTASMKTDSRSY